jgi:hypothetical protein
MGLQTEAWQREIKLQLFEANPFLKRMKNVDKYVNGLLIHIPQSGGPSQVQVDRTVYPAVATQRADTELVYQMKEFTTNPRHIVDRDMKELSYNKMRSMVEEDTEYLREEVAAWVLYEITKSLTAQYKIATTGDLAAASAPGVATQRRIMTGADFKRARLILNKQKVAKKGRVAILESNHLDQLTSDKDLAYAFQQVVNLKEGVVGRLFGFDIMEQAETVILDGTQTVMAPGASAGADDSIGSIFYQESMVERGMSPVKMFQKLNDPNYFGNVMSNLVRMGARHNRADQKGLIIMHAGVA